MNEEVMNLYGENVGEIGICVDPTVAMAAIVAEDPSVENTDGPRTVLRNRVVAAGRALFELEQGDPEVWESHDWMMTIDNLVEQIQAGLEPDLEKALTE